MNDQRALEDQLDELDHLAAKHGIYDAQDWLRTARARKAEAAVPQREVLHRGDETDMVFMVTHTVLVNCKGHKLPCTREHVKSMFEKDKRLKLVKISQEGCHHYIISGPTGVTYELYAERIY